MKDEKKKLAEVDKKAQRGVARRFYQGKHSLKWIFRENE